MNFDVSYLAILASTIIFMIVGTLWYGPLFGKPWRKLMNISADDMKNGSKRAMQLAMFGVLISAIVTSYVLAVLLKTLLITTIPAAFTLGFFVWLGFIATTMAHRIFFERSSIALYVLNAGQSLVAILLGALTIVMFPW